MNSAALAESLSAPIYLLYTLLVSLTIIQRLWELSCAKRHQAALKKVNLRKGEPERDYQLMVLVHVLWFVGLIVEPLVTHRTVPLWVACTGVVLFLFGQFLRVWALRTLGVRWNTRVLVPDPKHAENFIVGSGPYRFIRHPNYSAVILEIAALPLVGGAYLTCVVASLLNAVILWRRIRVEEQALFALPNYRETVGRNPRFFPKLTAFKSAFAKYQAPLNPR